MQNTTKVVSAKKFQVRQAGPIRLTSAATPLYDSDAIAKVICGGVLV